MSDLTIAQRVADDLSSRRFAEMLIAKFKMRNLDNSISLSQALWVHHRLRNAEIDVSGTPMQIDILNMAYAGDVNLARVVLGMIAPDDMTQDYHWLSVEKISEIRSEIAEFLGYSA
jgi:hypothetical protein